MKSSLRIILLLWQLEVVDTFTMLQFFVNAGSQYFSIVGASAAGNFSEINPRILLEPVVGLRTAVKFIQTGHASERYIRIATVASLLSSSATTISRDPASNMALGAVISAEINHMRRIIAQRRGATGIQDGIQEYFLIPSLKNHVVNQVTNPILLNPVENQEIPKLLMPTPVQRKFHENCDRIRQNMFWNHKNRCPMQMSIQKIKLNEFSKTSLCSVSTITSSKLTSLNSTILIGSILIGLVTVITLGGVHLYKSKCSKSNKIPIERESDKK